MTERLRQREVAVSLREAEYARVRAEAVADAERAMIGRRREVEAAHERILIEQVTMRERLEAERSILQVREES